jgi:hypothetical protein
MKVKIRGIYSTAITKLLLDSNIEVTQAADAIKAALNISEESAPDVMIEDIETKEGVYVYGSEPSKVIELLKKHFKESVFYKEDIGKIYCGIIKNTDQKSKSIVIALPEDEEGILDLKNFWGYVKPGSKILVQSKGTYDGKIMLSTQLRIFGENVIIIKNGFTKMSKGIRSHESRDKLYEIAKGLDLKEWGILWVQGAENKEESVLKQELADLMQKEKEITEKFNACTEPTLLYEGVDKYFTLFGKEDKLKLDKIRKTVMPTIPNHHTLKSAGYTILTDFAENIIDHCPDTDMTKKVNETLLRYGPLKNKLYRLAFTRLNGTSFKVDGMLEDVVVENDEVKSLRLTNKSDWGEKTYFIDAEKTYVIVKRGESEDRILTLAPEIFPKFTKITTFDIMAKKTAEGITLSNEIRIEKLHKRGEISNELKEHLKATLETLSKI